MMFKRYILRALVGAVLTLLAVGTANWRIDPYGIFGAHQVSGLNVLKPFAGDRGRIAKLYQVQRMKPRGLVIGNSRPEMGLDPDHACWPGSVRPVYNIALPGLSVYRQVRYAQHAIAVGTVSSLVMGLDFLDFLVPPGRGGDPRQWPIEALEARTLLTDANGQKQIGFDIQKAKDYSKAALSLDALIHSVGTVWRQSSRFNSTRTAAGFNPADGFYIPIVQSEGTEVLFAQKNRLVMKILTARRWAIYQGPTSWSTEFEAVQRMLRQSRDKGIQVKLFINPYHAEYLASIDIAGLWPLFEEWKRRLLTIASEEGNVPLWDFSAFDQFSTEPVISLAKTGEGLKWFWEPAHYRKELGDIMLANLWGPQCADARSIAPFGTLLNADRITGHLIAQRAAKERYVRSNQAIVKRLQALAHR